MELNIIPKPVSVEYRDGIFRCEGLPGAFGDEGFGDEITLFMEQLRQDQSHGYTSPYSVSAASGQAGTRHTIAEDSIRCRRDPAVQGDEAYQISVTPEKIEIRASAEAGMYHGLQTIRQLVLSGYEKGVFTLHCAEIEDRPRFSWRGFMLDTSRHFYTVPFIKRLIDLLSLHHLSIFHWHLTDDQGWRFPVKEYPGLTETGSKRINLHIPQYPPFGGFYSEEEILDVVAYAAQRHIEVVPEVEFPGHSSAILSAYPELGCTGKTYAVEDRYGIFEAVLCAGNDAVFDFAASVFDTLNRLFPSAYVHIGGDEVIYDHWNSCPKCRGRMEKLGLKTPKQLQSWFTARLAALLAERGKTAIGWDEVLEDAEEIGLPENLMVLSWRGTEGGLKASALKRRVIMAPLTEGCYFDYKHTDSPEELGQYSVSSIYKVYHMSPVPPGMDPGQAAYVAGGQANLWSELIYADRIAEYMIFPRLCALAENLWSPEESKDFEDFIERLPVHQRRLGILNVLQYQGPLT